MKKSECEKYKNEKSAKLAQFMKIWKNGSITNGDLVRIVEDYGTSKFMIDLYTCLCGENSNEDTINSIYVHISHAYHKARIYFDEH